MRTWGVIAEMRNSGIRAVTCAATLAVLVSSLGSGVAAAVPVARTTAPAVTAAVADAPLEQSTVEEKMAALDWAAIPQNRDLLALNDMNFVVAVWRKAKEGSELKSAALAAFTSEDSYAPTRFIK